MLLRLNLSIQKEKLNVFLSLQKIEKFEENPQFESLLFILSIQGDKGGVRIKHDG